MKAIKFLRAVIILVGILLSACAAAPSSPSAPSNVGGDKPLASDVVFTGVIESIDGNQWVINGQVIKVDSSVIRDGSFLVGDTVKVEAVVAADGSITAQRVKTPSAADLVEMTTSTPEASSTPQPLVFDDSGTEAFGTVESITDTSITIGGQTFTFAAGVEIKGEIVAGALVKLHFTVNPDGTLSVTEIEFADPSQIDNDNGNDDNSNDSNANDDNSNDDNGNDDNSNDDGNDNTNDDNSNDDSNDDNDGNSNDDDDNDNDDNSNDSNDNG